MMTSESNSGTVENRSMTNSAPRDLGFPLTTDPPAFENGTLVHGSPLAVGSLLPLEMEVSNHSTNQPRSNSVNDGRNSLLSPKYRKVVLGCIGFFILAVICTAIAIESYIPPSNPSSDSSSKPSSDFDTIQEIVKSISPEETLKDGTSPQRKALNWLAEEDRYDLDLSDTKRVGQRYAVALLYFHSGGNTWADDLNFLSDNHECLWHKTFVNDYKGVFCLQESNGNFDVDWLIIHGNNLEGSIPREIFSIPSLTQIVLDDNSLTGSIPSEIESLTKLMLLSLSNNFLTGSIPYMKQAQPYLEYLALSNNAFDKGMLPTYISELTSLKALQLNNNDFSGHLPTELGQLTNLNRLFLNSNNFSGHNFFFFKNMTKLESLDLAFNKLKGMFPVRLTQLENLKALSLHRNEFSGELPEQLKFMTRLLYLDVSWNKFMGFLPTAINQLTNLHRFYLESNDFEGQIDSQLFTNLTYLEKIYFHSNNFTGSIDFLCNRSSIDAGADCLPSIDGLPQVSCSCCHFCCNSTHCKHEADAV